MNAERPPIRLTSRVLTLGSLAAAVILGVGWLIGYPSPEIGKLMGNAGVVVLLLTPVAGLVMTWVELRTLRPVHAWLAIAVLGVLILATIVALAARA